MGWQPSCGAEGLLVGTLGWLKEPISGGTADRRRLGKLHGGSWLGKKRREGEEEKGGRLGAAPDFEVLSGVNGVGAPSHGVAVPCSRRDGRRQQWDPAGNSLGCQDL